MILLLNNKTYNLLVLYYDILGLLMLFYDMEEKNVLKILYINRERYILYYTSNS